jgi:hypothetical protein
VQLAKGSWQGEKVKKLAKSSWQMVLGKKFVLKIIAHCQLPLANSLIRNI